MDVPRAWTAQSAPIEGELQSCASGGVGIMSFHVHVHVHLPSEEASRVMSMYGNEVQQFGRFSSDL